jgi:hypothetical protein
MNVFSTVLATIVSMLMMVSRTMSIPSTLTSYSPTIKTRLLERRQLIHPTTNTTIHRKLIPTMDPSTVVKDGQYIVLFDPDTVTNATKKALQLFATFQIGYIYDNIVMKGVAIRNVTSQFIDMLESDPHILWIEPVRFRSSCIILQGRYSQYAH